MIKLVCQNCSKNWYTADTSPGQKCGDCGGELKEEDMENNKGEDDKANK
jgi:rRNA maturation endonuclease Nob1